MMSAQATICQAIRETRLLQFYYDGGTMVVEPHQLAYNTKDNLALSAYWIRGYSESGDAISSERMKELLLAKSSEMGHIWYQKPLRP